MNELATGGVVSQGSHWDWKTWKNGKAFSSQGILNRLEKLGKVRENHSKYWKTRGISETFYLLYFGDI